MEFKRIREKIEELEYHKNNDSITDKGSELLAELKQALQLQQGGVSGSFLVLTYAGSFVDYNLLPKGIYTTSVPKLFSKDTTIEFLEQHAKLSKDLVGNNFVPESYFENLKKCTLTSIDLAELK